MSYWLRQAVIMLAIAALALVGYWAFSNWQKRAQFKAIAELVTEGTAQLRGALTAPPTKENIASVETAIERLSAMRVSRQVAFAGAADTYLAGARTIMLRRADVERIAPQAAASRQAAEAHMNTPRGRNDDWIRLAPGLKKKMDTDQAELERVLKVLAELLSTFPETEKPVAAFVPSATLDEATRTAALKRTQADLKRATDEVTRIGNIVPR